MKPPYAMHEDGTEIALQRVLAVEIPDHPDIFTVLIRLIDSRDIGL